MSKLDDKNQYCELLKATASENREIASAAQFEFAQAIQGVLRSGILVGDIVSNIFERYVVSPTQEISYPLDVLAPGEEGQYVAYTNPGHGRIPERSIEGDYVMIPTYSIANSIDWLLKFPRMAEYNIVNRYMQVFENGFVKKINDDGWHTLITAAADRNMLVFDADASSGQFTKRLVSLMKLAMTRNGGGNTASTGRAKLTDLFGSLEMVEGIRSWGLDQVDEITRREIFTTADGTLTRVFGVNLHDLDEFGVDQEYQDFFLEKLGGSLAAGDAELVIGLDMLNKDSFLMPIRQELSVFDDPALHRSQRAGIYGWTEIGISVLDNRRTIVGSF